MMCRIRLCCFAAMAMHGQTLAPVVNVKVPGTSNPYLAGMPRGTKARYGDVAPDQSPVLVETSLRNASAVRFAAKGAVAHTPDYPGQFDPPNGSETAPHQGGAEHGISDTIAPMDSLVGVFLDDDRPDRSRAPKALRLRGGGRDIDTVSPELKQIFFIGDGLTKKGVRRRYMVPTGATRLFLGTMDGFEWNNNQGWFVVAVLVERTDVASNMYSVDSHISFAEWSCLPGRSQCTPDRPVVRESGPGQYHVVLPAQLEWGASIPTPKGATVTVHGASGTVCLDSQSRSTSSCTGPAGNTTPAGPGFLVETAGAGALVSKTIGERTLFSVNDRSGAFQNHQGYFEFDVSVK